MKNNLSLMNIRPIIRTMTVVTMLGLSPWKGLHAQDKQGETHTFTLQQCIDYAVANQDSLKNARLDIEKAEYSIKESRGTALPQITGSANIQDYLKVPTTLLPGEFFNQPGTFIPVKFGVKYQSSAGLNLEQMLFDGSFIVATQGYKTYRELFRKSYDRTRIAISTNVTKAYYQVLVSSEQIKLLDANIAQLKQQLTETGELNKQGFVEKIDVDRLTVLFNNLQTTRSNTIRMLALGTQVLKFQIGMPLQDNLVITEKISDIKLEPPVALSAADSSAYRNRIEYSLLQTSRRLNELDVKRNKSMALPKVSAFGSSSYSFQNNRLGDLYDMKFPTSIIGLRVNVPIFTGFQTKYRIKQAEVELKKADNNLHGLQNVINLQIEQSRTLYTNGMESLNSQRENMNLAREVLRVSKIKYEQGVGSSIEVTQAQTAVQEAENNYIQALYNALISKVDFDAAYGNIK